MDQESSTQKPRELHKGFVAKIFELPETPAGEAKGTNRLTGIIQVLEINIDQACKLVVSDGFAFLETIMLKSLHQKLTESKKMFTKHDVILASFIRHKTFYVLQDPQIIYQGMYKAIGDPILVNDYLKNGRTNAKGDSRIPAEFWEVRDTKAEYGDLQELERADEEDEANPIAMLTIGSTNWQIKARVESKQPIRTFDRKTGGPGQSKVSSIILYDHSSKILATLWTEAVDKFYDTLEVGKVYILSGGEVRRRGNFNTTNNDLELSFGAKMVCVQASSLKIPGDSFEFVPLNQVLNKTIDSYWDLVGIIQAVGTPEEIMTKKAGTKTKMALSISDDTNSQVEVSVWGVLCEIATKLQKGDIVIITKARVSEFQGKNLNTSVDSKIITKLPEHKKVKELIMWKNQHDKAGGLPAPKLEGAKTGNTGKDTIFLSHANYRRWCEENQDYIVNSSGTDIKLPLFTLLGFVAGLPISLGGPGDRTGTYYYDKCSNEKCYKKATQEPGDPNRWTCPNCGPLKDPAIPKYIGTVRTRDASGVLYSKMNGDAVGQELFGKTAHEIKNMEVIQDKDMFKSYIQSREGVLITMRIAPQPDTYQGEHRVTHKLVSTWMRTPKNVNSMTKGLIFTINLLARSTDA